MESGGKMTQKGTPRLFVGMAILVVAGLIAGFSWVTSQKPVSLDVNSQSAIEAKALIKRLSMLQWTISCGSGATVDMLGEVMVDSAEYKATASDKKLIERVYGKEALAHAGLLTSKKAYILSRDLPVPTPTYSGSGQTLAPTQKPVRYCGSASDLDNFLKDATVSQGQDGHLIVDYDQGAGRYEAILRIIDGHWKITSIKMIKFYGNG
jgi:hypothetical protein